MVFAEPAPVVWPVFPCVGPAPASRRFVDLPPVSQGPACAAPMLKAIMAQPARMSCFDFICLSCVSVPIGLRLRACREDYGNPNGKGAVPNRIEFSRACCGASVFDIPDRLRTLGPLPYRERASLECRPA